jgi:hypothetical protein
MTNATQSDRSFLCEAVKRRVRREFKVAPDLNNVALVANLMKSWPEILNAAQLAADEYTRLSIAMVVGIGSGHLSSYGLGTLPRGAAVRCRRVELRRNVTNLLNGHAADWPVPPDDQWPDLPSTEELKRLLEQP